MWQSIKTTLEEDFKYQYHILENQQKISFQQFFDLLIQNAAFRKFYNKLLADCKFEGYFWEHPPMTSGTLEKEYEFVLVKNKGLARIEPNPKAFATYFQKDQLVVDFDNLGRNARLVAPCPVDQKDYAHLARFTRQASESQLDAFWQRVGEQYLETIKKGKRWLSTSGLGVYWLHIRIDKVPKYYSHKTYRGL